MGRYWVKIDEAVEGPYESQLLKFLDGFTPDTLVSSEQLGDEELWFKAAEVDELRALLGIPEPPVQVSEPAPPQAPEPEAAPAVPEQVLVLPEATLSTPEPVEQVPIQMEPEPEVEDLPVSGNRLRLVWTLSGAFVVLLGLYWRLSPRWFRTKAPSAKVVVATVKTAPPPRQTPLAPPLVQEVVKNFSPKSKSVLAKNMERKPVPRSRKPVLQASKEPELKTQKYMLPGVPAPNVDLSTPTQNPAAGTQTPAEIAQEPVGKEKEPENSPGEGGGRMEKDTGKQFEDVEWMTHTGR